MIEFRTYPNTRNVIPETTVKLFKADEVGTNLFATWSVETVSLQYEGLAASYLRILTEMDPYNPNISTWLSIPNTETGIYETLVCREGQLSVILADVEFYQFVGRDEDFTGLMGEGPPMPAWG